MPQHQSPNGPQRDVALELDDLSTGAFDFAASQRIMLQLVETEYGDLGYMAVPQNNNLEA